MDKDIKEITEVCSVVYQIAMGTSSFSQEEKSEIISAANTFKELKKTKLQYQLVEFKAMTYGKDLNQIGHKISK